jgi:SAM-dependent methyltransferase
LVFNSVADAYASGRPDMPAEAVLGGAEAVGLRRCARVLEIGAGGGQLTTILVQLGFDVVALEPGEELRRRAAARAPTASFRSDPFEAFEPEGRFDAVFSSNAFHWLDPEVAYAKVADVADALVLIWNTPFIADQELHRRVQVEVMHPHGSTFPIEEEDVRRWVDDESAIGREELRASRRFEEPWWYIYERRLEYTPGRFVDLIGSMGAVAASPDRSQIMAELAQVLGPDRFDVVDLVYVVAAKAVER